MSNFVAMYYVRLLLLYLALASIFFLLMGLFKPWVMLWWEDTQNRKKVLQIYGTLTIVFLLAYLILQPFE